MHDEGSSFLGEMLQMIKILVDVPVEPDMLAQLKTYSSLEIEVIPFSDDERELPVDQIEDVEVLFCTVPPANCSKMQRLRWIQIASSGYSQLFPHDLPARRIRATNARGCFDVPIAEWNMAMMVSLVRNMPQMMRNQDSRVWDRSANFQREIRGMTLGLWGYGGLARETARLAKQFGMRVHVFARKGVKPAREIYRVPGTGDPEGILPDRVFAAGSEAEFLSNLDFLVLAMPLTSQTEGTVGERELRSLPRSAYILNPARGPLIQERPLLEALREGLIAGAAIDTHYEYPLPAEHPLWGFPNVILTPHIAGSSLNPMFSRRLWEIFVANVQRYTTGEALLNELSQQQLEGA
jgi:phosphoglycerate dehydrogenase-like enzyme